MFLRKWFRGARTQDTKARDDSFVAKAIKISYAIKTFGGEFVVNIVLELENGELRYASMPLSEYLICPFFVGSKVRAVLGDIYSFSDTGEYTQKTDGTMEYSGNKIRWLLLKSYKIMYEQSS